MQPWMANLIGLALGFTIGGVALYTGFATHEAAVEPPAAIAPVEPAPQALAAVPALPPRLRPVELPRITPPPLRRADPLPNVIYPTPPPEARHPGHGVAGTGFFVATDGTLLTAAHVVSGCAQIRITSESVKPTAAQMLAVDADHDIAVLRAARVRPPAVLSVGRPAGPTGRLFVLGYPASGGALAPTETWAVLQNAQFPPASAELTDPRRVIWASAPAVGHGFSGGPMLDPRNGEVVGIVRGMVESGRLHSVRAAIPASGMVIGPGSSALAALLEQQRAGGDAPLVSGADAIAAARRATVHVFCHY